MSPPLICFFSLALIGMATASFVAPVEKNPPFRRDRLPISSDLMISLSRDLATLTQGLPLDTPNYRRSAAQALALAIALDPANQGARDIVSTLVDGREFERPDAARFDIAKQRIWKSYEWLSLPQAGSDGNTLAALLGEPAHVLDVERQKPAAAGAGGSTWAGWVAPLSAFEKKIPADTDPFDEIGTKKSDPDPDQGPKSNGVIALERARVETVIYDYDEALDKWRQVLGPVKMEASRKAPEVESVSEGFTERRRGREFEITIPSSSSERFRIERTVIRPIEKALSSLHEQLPEKGQIKILPGANNRYSYKRNHTRLSGAGFILADAAMTGVEPQGVVLAELDDDGKLAVPTYFWQMISTISDVKGKKIVLPKGSEEYLVNLLILNKPEFFLENEVLLGSSNEEFIALCAERGTPEREGISAKFKEIAEKAKDNPLGPYLTNRFVRERLEEIVSAAPYHMSAKFLVLQGSPVRPRYLSKKVLAAEVWSTVDPLHMKIEAGLDPSTSNQLDAVYETMREKLGSLEKFADLRGQEVIGEGKELLSKTRSYMRTLRGRRELWERYDEIYAARNELIKTNNRVRVSLSEISDDPLPEELEKLYRRSLRDGNR